MRRTYRARTSAPVRSDAPHIPASAGGDSSLLPDAQGPTTAIRPGTLSVIVRISSLLSSLLRGNDRWNRETGGEAPNAIAGCVWPYRHNQHADIIARATSLNP